MFSYNVWSITALRNLHVVNFVNLTAALWNDFYARWNMPHIVCEIQLFLRQHFTENRIKSRYYRIDTSWSPGLMVCNFWFRDCLKYIVYRGCDTDNYLKRFKRSHATTFAKQPSLSVSFGSLDCHALPGLCALAQWPWGIWNLSALHVWNSFF